MIRLAGPSKCLSVPTIDTFGCGRFHPFGNGKPQKRASPATRERRKPWRRQAPAFPEPVIHRELAFQAQIPRQSRQRVLAKLTSQIRLRQLSAFHLAIQLAKCWAKFRNTRYVIL